MGPYVTKLQLSAYPKIGKLRSQVEYLQVNKTLRVKYRIDFSELAKFPKVDIRSFDAVKVFANNVVCAKDFPKSFYIKVDNKLCRSTGPKFIDSYIDAKMQSIVLNFAFQADCFIYVSNIPRSVDLVRVRQFNFEDMLNYIGKRPKFNMRKPLGMPNVVKKNMGIL